MFWLHMSVYLVCAVHDKARRGRQIPWNWRYRWLFVTRLIETQRQKLGFNLKARKAKQPATDSYLYLSPKWRPCLQESSEWDWLGAIFSCLIFLSSAGIKGYTLPQPGSYGKLVWLLVLKVCVTTAWSVRIIRAAAYTLWPSGKLYL